MSQQSFIVMGGSDESNGDYSRLKRMSRGRPKTSDGWGCQKETHKGDELWFYITAPVSAIVAVGSSLRDAQEGKNWNYDTKVGEIDWIEPHISKAELCQLFPKWAWPIYTRGRVQLNAKQAAKLRDRLNNSNRIGSAVEKFVSKQGAGFGNPAQNRLVERAAIRFVTRCYQRDGFKVVSVESKNLGYDLVASKGSLALHLEVKGVSGNSPDFIITANELRAAKADGEFRLVIVLNALKRDCEMVELTGQELVNQYDLSPLAYRAVQNHRT